MLVMDSKGLLAHILSTCLLMQCIIAPVLSAPSPNELTELESKQSPLAPSQFALAATRFIVMLPFLPILMAIPGATGVLMPLFMAMQDRLKTIIPNLPNVMGGGGGGGSGVGSSGGGQQSGLFNLFNIFGGGGNNNNNNQQGAGDAAAAESTNTSPTFFRFKRSLIKLPTKALNEGFREVFDFLYRTDDVINHLMSSQPDCRRQVVCRLHHSIDPGVGNFLGNLIQVLKLENRVEKLDVSDTTRVILKDILKAANTGLFQQDCSSVYSRCSLDDTARLFL